MGEELLKKTGAGNLFMVFGEPDEEIRKISPQIAQMDTEKKSRRDQTPSVKSVSSVDQSSGVKIVVEIKGVDA